MVHVALQGSWDESFHRYMSAGLTPCLRVLGLVLKHGQTETVVRRLDASRLHAQVDGSRSDAP